MDLEGKAPIGGEITEKKGDEIIEIKKDRAEDGSAECEKRTFEQAITGTTGPELETNTEHDFSIVEEGEKIVNEESEAFKPNADTDTIDKKLASISDAVAAPTGNEKTNRHFDLVEQLVDLQGNTVIGGEIIEKNRDEIVEKKTPVYESANSNKRKMEEEVTETTKPKMTTHTEFDSSIVEEEKIDKWQSRSPKINTDEDVIDEKIELRSDKVAATKNRETNFNSELVQEPKDLAGNVAMGGEISENKRDGPEDESDESNKRKIEENLSEDQLETNPDCEFSTVEKGDKFCDEQSQSPKSKADKDMIDEKMVCIGYAEAAAENEESNSNFNLVEKAVDLIDNLTVGGGSIEKRRRETNENKRDGFKDKSTDSKKRKIEEIEFHSPRVSVVCKPAKKPKFFKIKISGDCNEKHLGKTLKEIIETPPSTLQIQLEEIKNVEKLLIPHGEKGVGVINNNYSRKRKDQISDTEFVSDSDDTIIEEKKDSDPSITRTKRKLRQLGNSDAVVSSKKLKLRAKYRLNISGILKKDHLGKSLREIIKLPPSALQGLTEEDDKALAKFRPGVRTIEDLGSFQYFLIARAIVALAEVEAEDGRNSKSEMNINNALDKEYEPCSFNEMCSLPVEALQGVGKKSARRIRKMICGGKELDTIYDLYNYKYSLWAEALVTLSQYETDNFQSKNRIDVEAV